MGNLVNKHVFRREPCLTSSSGADHPRQARIYLELPPQANVTLTREYHNRLMLLCQVSFSQLSDSIVKKAQKEERKPKVEVKERATAEAGSGASGSAGVAPVVARGRGRGGGSAQDRRWPPTW